jgi:hypothetical protein
MTTLAKSATRVAIGVGLLLLIPLFAKLILSEMKWGVEDFVAAGILLFGAGMVYTLVIPRANTRTQRFLVAAAVLLVLATVWAELAVGLFD